MFQKMPKGDGKLPRHGDYSHLPASCAILREPSRVPSGEFTSRLMTHPRLGYLDKQAPRRLVPGLADALVSLHVTTGKRGWGESQIGCQVASA